MACLNLDTLEALYNGQVGSGSFFLYMEVVLFEKLQLNINVLSSVTIWYYSWISTQLITNSCLHMQCTCDEVKGSTN